MKPPIRGEERIHDPRERIHYPRERIHYHMGKNTRPNGKEYTYRF
jgi:hypothetical protein